MSLAFKKGYEVSFEGEDNKVCHGTIFISDYGTRVATVIVNEFHICDVLFSDISSVNGKTILMV